MWKFIKSSTINDNFLMGHAKEVAFIGRSNVGKSSLINALVKQKTLARTSNTPGRTQLINFFQDDDGKTFVDLPGYGYAKMPLEVKEKMFSMIENYFETRKELINVFVLVDSKIGPTIDDIKMIEYLLSIGRTVFVVMTKTDKARQSEIFKSIKKVENLNVEYIQVSSHKGKNINKLRNIINMFFK